MTTIKKVKHKNKDLVFRGFPDNTEAYEGLKAKNERLLEACKEALALVKSSPWGKDNPHCYKEIEQAIQDCEG